MGQGQSERLNATAEGKTVLRPGTITWSTWGYPAAKRGLGPAVLPPCVAVRFG
jgi:hypothetical protein